MDACLTQTVPDAPSPPLKSWRSAALAVIAIGLAWRLVRYACQFPIWGDEAMLLLNILDRDFLGLTEQLRFCQVAPLLFLWLERVALLVFGTSEWAVHLFPLLLGCSALLLFWQTCRVSFSPTIAGVAAGLLAVSYYPVRHACEVKPYAFDLFIATAYLAVTMGYLRARGSGWLLGLAALTPIAVFSSYPSVFVGGAVSLVLLPSMRSASWGSRGFYALFNLLLIGSFAVHYLLVGHHGPDAAEAVRAREFLHNYWREAFPPSSPSGWPLWLLEVFTGRMLAYPLGANHGGSSATFALVLLGSVALWRSNRRTLLALCWLPFALNLLASILGKYPFGGSARIMQHLAPFICVLMAHGAGQLLDWVRSPSVRSRVQLLVYGLLIACGIVGIVRDLAKPQKTEHDRDVRAMARDLARQVSAKEPVILCNPGEKAVLPELQWYLRTPPLEARWLSTWDAHPPADACWLFLCGHHEQSVAEVLSAAGYHAEGWHVTASAARVAPPENAKMQTIYCRWVRVRRIKP